MKAIIRTKQDIDATEVVAGLAIGGLPPIGNALAAAGWDAVVLCANDGQPRGFRKIRVIRCPFGDLSHEGSVERQGVVPMIDRAVDEIVRLHGDGKRVLVTCLEGRNRSALVATLAASRILGTEPLDALRRLRRLRNRDLYRRGYRRGTNLVVDNALFEEHLRRRSAGE